jgi:HYDIN/CFA65/VesB-like, Ig-like domain
MRRLSTILTCTMLAGLTLAGTTVAAQAQQVPRAHAVPKISVRPSPVEFGPVQDGRTVPRDVFIQNKGPGTLDIGNVSISEDIDFSGGGGFCQFTVLAVNEGCRTTVSFTPTGRGDRTATLYIMSQDGRTTWAAVPLHGRAVR